MVYPRIHRVPSISVGAGFWPKDIIVATGPCREGLCLIHALTESRAQAVAEATALLAWLTGAGARRGRLLVLGFGPPVCNDEMFGGNPGQ